MIVKFLNLLGLAKLSELQETARQMSNWKTVAEEVMKESNAIIVAESGTVIRGITLTTRKIVISPGATHCAIMDVVALGDYRTEGSQ